MSGIEGGRPGGAPSLAALGAGASGVLSLTVVVVLPVYVLFGIVEDEVPALVERWWVPGGAVALVVLLVHARASWHDVRVGDLDRRWERVAVRGACAVAAGLHAAVTAGLVAWLLSGGLGAVPFIAFWACGAASAVRIALSRRRRGAGLEEVGVPGG